MDKIGGINMKIKELLDSSKTKIESEEARKVIIYEKRVNSAY